MSESDLMAAIKTRWGALITDACHASSVPEAFLAALIALESGGKPDATRYEPAIFKRLQVKHPEWDGERLTNNATSWGLTQILGINYPGNPVEMADPATNLNYAITMLAKFAERYDLNLACDFEELFHCWNTGVPCDPPATYDPNYVPLGLKRIEVWKSLP